MLSTTKQENVANCKTWPPGLHLVPFITTTQGGCRHTTQSHSCNVLLRLLSVAALIYCFWKRLGLSPHEFIFFYSFLSCCLIKKYENHISNRYTIDTPDCLYLAELIEKKLKPFFHDCTYSILFLFLKNKVGCLCSY
ncbi:hypothetical protein I3843_12G073000 [Carya illinoinensis]|nr:hypothetical protein I3843_12G073000 [Carya illinoinensis]